MAVSKLPNECLQIIFNDIDDLKTLHSVILVNRNWCQNCIKRLWKKPFRTSTDQDKQIKICPILIQFIIFDEELKVKEKLINGYYKKYKKANPNPSQCSFDYPSFITDIDLDRIIQVVSLFVQLNKNKLYLIPGHKKIPKIDQILTFVLIMLRVMVLRGANIKRFIISQNENYICMILTNEFALEQWNEAKVKIENILSIFLTMDATKRCLKNLKNFMCDMCDMLIENSMILSSLISICTKLQEIRIQNYSHSLTNDSLISLIQRQKSLEFLHIQGSLYHSNSNITQLVLSLEKNASSYKKIILEGGYVDNDCAFKSLMNCKDLEVLQIKDVKISYKNLEILDFAEFPKLKCLSFINTELENMGPSLANPFIAIIKNEKITSRLQKLHLIGFLEVENYNLLKTLAENFKNLNDLNDLCVQITRKEEIPLLILILENCLMIKQIRLVNPISTYNFNAFKIFIREWSAEQEKTMLRIEDQGAHIYVEWE
ncbi:2180_t:CDS:2 [Funneliformis geosporum]|uniref:13980_t:CDS:1 n=1 Tax=Funneliformis geosporum TaxID=1117311 RepID=A0A9W4SLU2_9GLOM|nr:13980_t:CDS:2 [Funneliformis geosporum]CAI2179863.1 2180_t:CDS:2 [Funneliformis geosporum]